MRTCPILRCVTTLTSKRRVVEKASDDGITRPSSSPEAATSQTNSSGISTAAIAGAVIGSFALGILIMFISYMFWRRRRIAQANSLATEEFPKVEAYTEERMNDSMAWGTPGDENTAMIANPSVRQKGRQYQTPPIRHDDSSDAYPSGRSVSIQGTAFTSLSPPSYFAATTSNSGTR